MQLYANSDCGPTKQNSERGWCASCPWKLKRRQGVQALNGKGTSDLAARRKARSFYSLSRVSSGKSMHRQQPTSRLSTTCSMSFVQEGGGAARIRFAIRRA